MPFKRPLGERIENQTPPNFFRPLTDKRVVVGQSVILECQVSANPDPVLKWLKDGQNVTQCPDYEVLQSDGKCALKIDDVQGSDGGRFTCQAMNAAGTKQTNCMLIVAPAPTPVPGAKGITILSPGPRATPTGPAAPYFAKDLKHQPLKIGSTLALECRITGNPMPQPIQWLKNGKPILNYRAKVENNLETGICALLISMLKTEDIGEYTCIATNQHGTAQTSAKVLHKDEYDKWLSEEQSKITKEKKLNLLAELQRNKGPNKAGFTQKSRTHKMLDQRNLDAESSDMAWGVSESETEPELAAFEQQQMRGPGSAPIIRTNAKHQSINQGTDAVLQFNVMGNPKPRIQWFKDDMPLPQTGKRSSMNYKGLMAVYNINMAFPEDSGDYSIVAENQYGKSHSTIHIDVLAVSNPQAQQRFGGQVQFQQQQQRANGVAKKAPPPLPQKRPFQQQQTSGYNVSYQMGIKAPQFVKHPTSLSVMEGESATFDAKIVGHPIPQILWTKADGSELDLTIPEKYQIASSFDGSTTSLVVSKCTQEDANTYQCTTWNQGGQMQTRCSLNVIQQKSGPSAPPQFVGKFQSVTVYEDDSLNLYCKSTGEGVKLSWLKDGQPIGQGSPYKISSPGGNESTLQIKGAKLNDAGWYQCNATNAAGTTFLRGRVLVQERISKQQQQQQQQQRPSEKVAFRKVDSHDHWHPKADRLPDGFFSSTSSKEPPKWLSPVPNLSLIEGQSALFDCHYSPWDDANLKIVWLVDGKAVVGTYRTSMTAHEGRAWLQIDPVVVADKGRYSAVAVNQLGEAVTEGILLVAGYNAVFAEKQTQQKASEISRDRPNFHSEFHSLQVFEGSPARFECKLTPHDDPNLKVEWFFNDKSLKVDGRTNIIRDFDRVLLELSDTVPEDAGTYVCVATNSIGSTQNSATLLVQVNPNTIDRTQQWDAEDVRQASFATEQKPAFITHLCDCQCDKELGLSRFEARISPRHDLSLRVHWLKDGRPIQTANRIHSRDDFGLVSLVINPTYPEDAGVYTCVLENRHGHQVSSSARLATCQISPLVIDSRHADSIDAIQFIEDQKVHIGPILADRPEEMQSVQRPTFSRPLCDSVDVEEGHSVHFECRLLPADDPKMAIQWFHNENALVAAHRFRPMFDFGYVALDILYAYPEDSGTYTVVATNELGQVASSARLKVNIRDTLNLHSQHPQGLERIQQLESARERALTEMPDRECSGPPNFVGQLDDQRLEEGDNLHIELKVDPVLDPTMKVDWFVDGRPLLTGSRVKTQFDFGFLTVDIRGVIPEDSGEYFVRVVNDRGEAVSGCLVQVVRHRFRVFHDFGFVSLDILTVYPEDAGSYECVARNAQGEATTCTQIQCTAKSSILDDTHHPLSVDKIREIEAPKPVLEETPELAKMPPQFVKSLGTGTIINILEGEKINLEAQIVPVDDPYLKTEWYLNDQPLMKAHRFVLNDDFGFASLNILYMYPEDSGEYKIVAKNRDGEVSCTQAINCQPMDKMVSGGGSVFDHPDTALTLQLFDSHHPASLSRIADLEAPRRCVEDEPGAPPQLPQLVKRLPEFLDNVHESQTLHMEAHVLPIDDSTLVVDWLHNDQPLRASSRHRLMNAFGFATLDIAYVNPTDEGTYTVVARNALGSVTSSTKVQVDRLLSVVADTQRPESLRRIRQLEEAQPAKASDPELQLIAPFFAKPLAGPTEILKEAQSVHMDCMVQPINDPDLKIEWFLNDFPILLGSRIRTIHDFGYVGLEFLHVHPEDSGTYICKATNSVGSATTECDIECRPKRSIYLDTYHQQSWTQIQEMENRVDERPPSPEIAFPPPTFTQTLTNVQDVAEGDSCRLECQLQPVSDPSLRVKWLRNGEPLQEGSRFMPARNFDYVNLDLLAVYPEDSGVYSCIGSSQFGEAVTSCTVKCLPKESLLLDTQHQESWCRIQEIESRVVPEPLIIEPEIGPPTFPVFLPAQFAEFPEGAPIHMECQVEPTNDNQLVVTWSHNGRPLANGHRCGSDNMQYASYRIEFHNITCYFHAIQFSFRTTHDFGYVSLDILYAFPEDSGTWTCTGVNEKGQTKTEASVQVVSRDRIQTDSRHPQSWRKIQAIEAPKETPSAVSEPVFSAPNFIESMDNIDRIEGQSAHFQTRFQPINDCDLQIEWFKDGQPLQNGDRFKHTADFGFVSLDISYTLPSDQGVYSVKIVNKQGEQSISAEMTVQSRDSLLLDTQHEQSWAKIQQLETPKAPTIEKPDLEYGPPGFTRELNSCLDLLEGQPAHFETSVEPMADPNLRISWFRNDIPLSSSSRLKMKHDFGLVTLDIDYCLPEDIGQYLCRVENKLGKADIQGELTCTSRAAILADTIHGESWARIQQLEAPKEPFAAPEPQIFQKPSFTHPLQSLSDISEGSSVILECRLIPVNDPNLRIEWYLNEQPLRPSNRHRMDHDFGHVALRINPVYENSQGVYVCKAVNALGEARTTAALSVQTSDSLVLESHHPESYRKVQLLEALDKFPRTEIPDKQFDKPNWTVQLVNVDQLNEGDIVHLEGQVEPADDPDLKVEWFRNGRPLRNANRFRSEHEFGHVTMDIIHVYPHDSGVYSCRAFNQQGEAVSSATVKVEGYESILRKTQHPVSWQLIQDLERPIIAEEVESIIEKEKPQFITQLMSLEDLIEGDPIHLEATFEPSRDSELAVVWLKNGHPLGASQLVKTSVDLGWAGLDISSANPDHTGVYTLTVTNDLGQAVSTALVKIVGVGGVLDDTQHELSWARIRELEAPHELQSETGPMVYPAPMITVGIEDVDCTEGDMIRFESAVEPADDPGLMLSWFRNGQPLDHGSKYAISQDFGISSLEIAYTFPGDEGVYQLKVANQAGEVVSSAVLRCQGSDAILGDTQHEQSWQIIQQIEAPKMPILELPEIPQTVPVFTMELHDLPDLLEGQSIHFETTIEPADDPNLKVQWLLNDRPVEAGSRVKMINDFGWIILDINQAESRDGGRWTCKVCNEVGEAVSNANVVVVVREDIIYDTQQPQSLPRIREIEAPKSQLEPPTPKLYQAPQFTRTFTQIDPLTEGDSVHLEAEITPIDDPNLKVDWFRNGHPLSTSARCRPLNDFGFCILDIARILPEDAGEYQCRVANLVGQADCKIRLQITPVDGLVLHPQVKPETSRAINNLEESLRGIADLPDDSPKKCSPIFTDPLSTPAPCFQGGSAHFAAHYQPFNDADLKIEWFFCGRPLQTGSRVKTLSDFGYVVLEISPVHPQDAGEYICKVSNSLGEAVTSVELQCHPDSSIVVTSQLPPSMAGAQVEGRGGVSYEWQSPESRKERINQLEDWLHRPADTPQLLPKHFEPPKFVDQLTVTGEMAESERITLQCRLEPIGDPSLTIEWLHDGNPIPHSNRIMLSNDFGIVTLVIKYLIAQDSGDYTCVANTDIGTAETVGTVNVQIIIDTEAPQIIQPLVSTIDQVEEGDSVHLECRITPITDPKLTVHWFHNDQILPEASRFRTICEFGFVSLDILYTYPEDNGEYTLKVENDKGQCQTTALLTVNPLPKLLFGPQARGSNSDDIERHLRQYTNCDIALTSEDAYDNRLEQKPVFRTKMINIGLEEEQFGRFETQISPMNDPYMKVEWMHNGQFVKLGHRFRATLDFGFVSLDLLYALPDDTGEYICIVSNKHGQASTSAKLACAPSKRVITECQLPQGMQVATIGKLEQQLYWAEQAEVAGKPMVKCPPVFTIPPRPAQTVENQPTRFECAIVGYPKPKLVWYINGNQAIQGQRFRMHFDGMHYLILANTRIADAGEILAIAKNSEGEAMMSTSLDVYVQKNFRHVKLRPTLLKSGLELEQREQDWHTEMMGSLGEAFEKAPRPDCAKLMKACRGKSPPVPLETEELVEKFTRKKGEDFYEKFAKVEQAKRASESVQLEPVELRPGHVERYQPPMEEMESVHLRRAPRSADIETKVPPKEGVEPEWTRRGGGRSYCYSSGEREVAGRFRQKPKLPEELTLPAKDQVKLKMTKPKGASELPATGHVMIETDKAQIRDPIQGPVLPKAVAISAADQVQLKSACKTRTVNQGQGVTLEDKMLKQTPPIVKLETKKSTVPSTPQPTKMGQSLKTPPIIGEQLRPAQVEMGSAASFSCTFQGDKPIKITWFKDDKQISSSFEFQIVSNDDGSCLKIAKTRKEMSGKYVCRLENVAGKTQSCSTLTVVEKKDQDQCPIIVDALKDVRTVQGQSVQFDCSVGANPQSVFSWFKDGKTIIPDVRLKILVAGCRTSLLINDVRPQDVGVYECVAKNSAGEARCKAKLSVNLTKTGGPAEAGLNMEAPKFVGQLQSTFAEEGKPAKFEVRYTGDPEPTLRWYRNNEPVRKSRHLKSQQKNGIASLEFAECVQEDMAEYKVEAVNTAGKATSVATLQLQPKGSKGVTTKVGQSEPISIMLIPHFTKKLSDIVARQGQKVRFSTEFGGDPPPGVSWLFNGKPLSANKDIKMEVKGNVAQLELQRITSSNVGEYTLTLKSVKGGSQCSAKLKLEGTK